jgi:hypothetical protein
MTKEQKAPKILDLPNGLKASWQREEFDSLRFLADGCAAMVDSTPVGRRPGT